MRNRESAPYDGAVEGYLAHLRREERSPATIEKYARYVRAFRRRLAGRTPTKEAVLEYKETISALYTAAGANGMLAAVNSFLGYLGQGELKIKLLRVQRKLFRSPSRELERGEYEKLLRAAQNRGQERMGLILQTMFSTGIRISELAYITVEVLRKERAEISLKGKARVILLPPRLCRKLLRFARARGIGQGSVFVTRSGRPVDRSNVWKAMKRLCGSVRVAASKVFPHNLRHLFARVYYGTSADLVGLAAILGHGDINTTRVYVSTSGKEYQRRLDALFQTKYKQPRNDYSVAPAATKARGIYRLIY